ncbi:Zinc finger BED domain-containing protein 4 [Merluccius polli]|uniref:Zinc finger BED domain-containing protein 4 n=1 Tax=Merluccius polli TaxID=89951 RepID=A0AA47M6A0_MERPO|nr:Zinc finger BED domain-containing protein 4 [Merluccius polli]
MVVKDLQPFSVVNDQGFRGLVNILDPSYVLPTRQALKAMVEERHEKGKREAKALVLQPTAVSLTSDMWTSMNMDAYLGVTCHFISDGAVLNTTLLGVQHFPKCHTALNLAEAMGAIMEEWGIKHKITCLVTDAASNMLACGREMHLKQAVCIAHAINLIVKKSLDETPGLDNLRTSARRIVTLFRSSTTAKERLAQMQEQGRPVRKLLKEVETRWNSTYIMLERLHSEREAVSAAMASLHTEVTMITPTEFAIIEECLGVLGPFNEATVELSEEKRVSASKILPLLKMVSLALAEQLGSKTTEMAKNLTKTIQLKLMESLSHFQKTGILTLPTLLDPRFKTLGFLTPSKADEAVKRLTTKCAQVISHTPSPLLNASVHEDEVPSTSSGGLWRHLDATVQQNRLTNNATADAIVEVQRYLKEAHINRADGPLQYWNTRKSFYAHLYILSLRFLCTPASSVPCERVFSKAGEVVSKKRNRLSPKVLEQILFLNKNN